MVSKNDKDRGQILQAIVNINTTILFRISSLGFMFYTFLAFS